MVLHRRAGKTTAVLNQLQRDCLRIVESQFAYTAILVPLLTRLHADQLASVTNPVPSSSRSSAVTRRSS